MMTSEISEKNVRQPVVAGSFYPADPKTLSSEIRIYLGNATSEDFGKKPMGLISPHAGYIYSGQVAAYAYKQVEGISYDAVIVIAPSHQAYFPGASVDRVASYRTPLGLVPVDTELSEQIIKESDRISHYPQAHAQEHSLEVQLPFLQEVLPEFKLVPVIMGDQDITNCEKIAEAISHVIKKRDILVVASSDLSHYHQYDEAKLLDQKVIDRINSYDPHGLGSDLSSHKNEACGGGPIMTAMLIGRHLGANRATVIHYANSGDVTGDYSGVVGYAAGVIYNDKATENSMQKSRKAGVDLGLNDDEKKLLHKIAKESIKSTLEKKPLPDYRIESGTLNELRGAFVSLHKQGMLRGCIGHIRSDKPLHETVKDMAAAAAFEDPRFPSLSRKEFDQVAIEISVLTPFRKITDINEIEVGKHGIYMVKGFYSGLLLPQVATEYGWDRITFLEHTCNKSGLRKDEWKEKDTEIYIFSADVF